MTSLEILLAVTTISTWALAGIYGAARTYHVLRSRAVEVGKENAVVDLAEHQEFRVGALALIRAHREELDRLGEKIRTLEERVNSLEQAERDLSIAIQLLDAHGVPHTLNLTP